MGHKSPEGSVDLTSRLRQLEQLDPSKWVAPRRPLDAAPDLGNEEPSGLSHLVPSGGRMFVCGTQAEPQFRAATWLSAARAADE